MSRGKKIAKWTGICLAIAIFIVCLPFLLLRMALSESVSNKILETVVPDFANAEARIGHIDYALLSSWPDVELGIKDITVISKVFEPADTLLHIDSIGVSVNAGDFLNYGDIRINRLHVDDPHFYIKRSNGKLNAGILLPSDTAATDTAAFAMPDEHKQKQEKMSLLQVKDSFKKIIVVKDVVNVTRDENGITTMSVYDFLLKDNSLEL